jgi:hypothetical protein
VRRIEAAAAAGEVRRDLRADTLARWVVRISFSLSAEPATPEDCGDQGVAQPARRVAKASQIAWLVDSQLWRPAGPRRPKPFLSRLPG